MEKKKKKITVALRTKPMIKKNSNTDCDQDSDISFMNDTDEEIETAEIEEEDWIDHMKRSTDEAMERMKAAKSNAGSKHTEE